MDRCPHCGYCPHCGRSNTSGWPYYQPYWPYSQPYIWYSGTSSMSVSNLGYVETADHPNPAATPKCTHG